MYRTIKHKHITKEYSKQTGKIERARVAHYPNKYKGKIPLYSPASRQKFFEIFRNHPNPLTILPLRPILHPRDVQAGMNAVQRAKNHTNVPTQAAVAQ